MARFTSMPPAHRMTQLVAWMNFSPSSSVTFTAHDGLTVEDERVHVAVGAHLGPVLLRLLGQQLQGDQVHVDAVGGRGHALPLQHARAGGARVHGHPLGAGLLVHPVDALRAFHQHSAHEIGVAGLLLAAHDVLQDAIHVVGVLRIGEFALFSRLVTTMFENTDECFELPFNSMLRSSTSTW